MRKFRNPEAGPPHLLRTAALTVMSNPYSFSAPTDIAGVNLLYVLTLSFYFRLRMSCHYQTFPCLNENIAYFRSIYSHSPRSKLQIVNTSFMGPFK